MRIVEQRPVIRSTARARVVARRMPGTYWDELEERDEARDFLLMAIGGVLIPLLLTTFVYFIIF
ncbi:MAG TPA: hypothetical protein VKZ96_12035 [Thermomicrobiales bacterium]|nr:hypothetical protein [Thermomicrobiales bacterium]